MNRSVSPLLTFRCPRWPFSDTMTKEIKSLQFWIFSILIRSNRLSDDSPASFMIRRNRDISGQMDAHGSWAILWRDSDLKWHAHLQRARDKSWIVELPFTWDACHFQRLRLEHRSASLFGGRAGIRSSPGAPNVRWDQGILNATAFNAKLPGGLRMNL